MGHLILKHRLTVLKRQCPVPHGHRVRDCDFRTPKVGPRSSEEPDSSRNLPSSLGASQRRAITPRGSKYPIHLRFPVPNTMKSMVFGARGLKYWVLGAFWIVSSEKPFKGAPKQVWRCFSTEPLKDNSGYNLTIEQSLALQGPTV